VGLGRVVGVRIISWRRLRLVLCLALFCGEDTEMIFVLGEKDGLADF